jgi:hypothetical protein
MEALQLWMRCLLTWDLEVAMRSFIFENIEHHKSYQAKIFISSLEASVFHWHYAMSCCWCWRALCWCMPGRNKICCGWETLYCSTIKPCTVWKIQDRIISACLYKRLCQRNDFLSHFQKNLGFTPNEYRQHGAVTAPNPVIPGICKLWQGRGLPAITRFRQLNW